MKEKTDGAPKKGHIVVGIIVSLLIVVAFVITILYVLNNNKDDSEEEKEEKSEVTSQYAMANNDVQDFDLYFLKQNKKSNVVYSPLSIKYALSMLSEGASGDTKEQIDAVIGKYVPKKYTNSSNMSFANAIFIRENYKDSIKEQFVSNLSSKYNAEVIYDKFENVNNINSWVSNKTLKLINNLVSDIDPNEKYILINALGIDMEWKSKFVLGQCDDCSIFGYYAHEDAGWFGSDKVVSGQFKDIDEEIATMEVFASYNNYDIIKELGEDKIRKTVGDEYRKYLNEYNYSNMSSSEIEKEISRYLDEYVDSIKNNYKTHNKSTEFSLYVDDDIKVFAKDLKQYNGVTLQYVSIMPENEDLDEYLTSLDSKKINEILGKLIELKNENFKEGVVTLIKGTIPKFKFDYDIDLVEQLKGLGITDVFSEDNSNLSKISDEKTYIGAALHKANIEFTQDGIKASAATMMGGLGAGEEFNYDFEVPVEEIDLTFDKPYMFLVRDKMTGEVWFMGSVYEPSLWKNDPDSSYNY